MTEPASRTRPQAADIEILEWVTKDRPDDGPILPSDLVINGQSVMVPLGAAITVLPINDGDGADMLAVSMTVCARRVLIEKRVG